MILHSIYLIYIHYYKVKGKKKYPSHWGVKEKKQGQHVGFTPPPFDALQLKQRRWGWCESPSPFKMKEMGGQCAPLIKTERNGGSVPPN